MLTIAVVVGALGLMGALIVLKVAHVAIKRLGLDAGTVLEWLGLAEAQPDELATWRAAPPRRVAMRRPARSA